MNDNELELDPVVYIVIGRVWENEDASPDDAITIHALLTAPDDDDAVRKTLESLCSGVCGSRARPDRRDGWRTG